MGERFPDEFAHWCDEAAVSAVLPGENRHSIHTYFNVCPESPDGRWVLYFASPTPEGHEGDLCIVERSTGEIRVLARGVVTEDAHRVACQQWVSGGRRVVFHDLRDGAWVIVSVDVETLEERVLATGRQLAWGLPEADLVPVYGPHWDPEAYRDLDVLDVETGDLRTVVTADEVMEKYGNWISERFGGQRVSCFFPCLSPDLDRIFFKLSAPLGGDFRSKGASDREGLICYDLERSRFLFLHKRWGHPAWHPDSWTIINTPNVLINAETGECRSILDLPQFPGSHPSISPGGRLFVTDTRMDTFGGEKGDWGIVVGDLAGGHFEVVHAFPNAGGATSWRPPHPHPIFSGDGRRVYFNVGSTEWTRLYVAEAAGE